MKVFVYVFLLLMVWLPKEMFSQQLKVAAMGKDITTDAWSADAAGNTLADTLWFVNFNVKSGTADIDSVVLKMKLSKPEHIVNDGYDKVTIDWGDRTPTQTFTISANEVSHTYKVARCQMTMTLKNDSGDEKKVYREIFNRTLEGQAKFVLKKDGREFPISGCMEKDGVDTVLVCMYDHLNNPPGTTYKIEANAGGVEVLSLNERNDSCYVIFKEPNGSVDGLGTVILYIEELKANPADKKSPVTRNRVTAKYENLETVNVYAKPDLRKIFGFRDSIAPGLTEAPVIEVCSKKQPDPSDIKYNESENQKYFYGFSMEPYYRDGSNFTAEYYWKDSYDGTWRHLNPAVDKDYVDTTRREEDDLRFNVSGLYKIRFEAWNDCGRDTLWTDSIPNRGDAADPTSASNWVRYIKVAESGEGNLYSYQDTGCLRKSGSIETDTITFVDKGRRIALDFYPGYSFQVDKLMKSVAGQDSIVTYNLKEAGNTSPAVSFYEQKTWLNGGLVTADWGSTASDSVVMRLVFKEVGTYQVTLSRGGGPCDTVKYIDTLRIGARPQFKDKNLLLSAFTGENHNSGDTIDMCGAFRYVFPSDLKINNNNLKLDTVAWYFKNGNRQDFARPDSAAYHFNHTGDSLNKLKVTARNYCGEDSLVVPFYTRVIPNVELWRDSIPSNDSLCINFTYDYFFKGELPEFYTIKARFSQPVDSGGYSKEELIIHSDSVIRTLTYKEQETVKENYVITNDKNTACVQTSEWKSVFILQPDSLAYRDSIMHCTGFDEFNGQKLFNNPNPQYKSLAWTYNGGDFRNDNDPVFTLRDDSNDTLRVIISNSKGCYVNQQIIFIPKAAPTFDVKPSVNTETGNLYNVLYCAVDSIPYLDIVDINTDEDSVAVSVYKQSGLNKELFYGMNGSTKVEKSLVVDNTTATPDRFYIRYELENKKVTPGFGDCTLADSILVNVSKPRLSIKPDTVRDKNLISYDFSTVQVDTNQITIATNNVWKAIGTDMRGTLSSHTSLYDAKYTLHTDDARNLDSLLFEVKGITRCGDILKDTLVVFISRGRIFPKTDTICEDTKNYKLWGEGKTWGEFIDTATLEWAIVDGGGTLSANGKGSGVCYTPAAGDALLDSVKIEVKGTVNFSDNIKTGIVVLKVNPRPVTTFADTLWIGEDTKMIVKNIPEAHRWVNNAESYEWKTIGSNGSWTMPNDMDQAVYNWGRENSSGMDMIQQVFLEMKGKQGCGTYRDTVKIIRSGTPKFSFKYGYDLCEDDNIRIDTSYKIDEGSRRYLKLTWSIPSGKAGSFNVDSTEFIWAAGIQPDSLTLTVDKVVPHYTGVWRKLNSPNKKSNPLKVYEEPVFALSQQYDTLCHNINAIKIPAGRIKVVPDKYAGNLRYDRSVGVSGTFPDLTIGNTLADTGKVVAYADLGRCKKWIGKTSDTLYLVHIPQVVVSFSQPDPVCENGRVEIKNVSVTGPFKDTTWLASPNSTAKIIREGDKIYYAPNSSGQTGGVIVLKASSRKTGCGSAEKSAGIEILKLPDIKLNKHDTTCDVNNTNYTLLFTQPQNAQYIKWYANDVYVKQTQPTESNVVFTNVSSYAQTIPGKKERLVKIKAVITPVASCVGTVQDSLELILWPNAGIKSVPSLPDICQGGSVAISGINVEYAGSVSWTAPSPGSFSSSNTLNTTYYPGETFGNQQLLITVMGEKGCQGNSVSQNIGVKVNYIPKPAFESPDVLCQNSEILFTNTTSVTPSTANWEWTVNNVTMSYDQDLKHTYTTPGTYNVKLTETIGACNRTVEDEITINAQPVPEFKATTGGSTPIDTLGKDIAYYFVNETSGDNSFVWKFQNGSNWDRITDQHTNYTFHDPYTAPGAEVRLIAKNRFECVDSVSRNYVVVEKPVVSFTINPDNCGGLAKYIYTGTITPGTVLDWNLGNGRSASSPEFTTQYPASNYGDTVYYVSLKVTNPAAPEGVIKTDSVKIISNLTPTFNIVGGMECVSPIDVYLHSQLCLGRPDSCWVSWGDGTVWKNDSLPKKNISHTYANDTENDVLYFTVTLRVRNACHDVKIDTVIPISPNNVQASISPDKSSICWGESVTFTNLSRGFDGNNMKTSWDFGEGNDPEVYNGIVPSVTHPFMMPGTYQVKIKAEDKCNKAESRPIFIYVKGDRSLTFDVAGDYCSAQELKMSVPDSLIRDNRFYNYQWEFGDGTSDYNGHSRVVHNYRLPQTYRAKLTATASGTDCKSEWVKDLAVKRTPRAAIGEWSETTGCAPLTIVLAGTGGLGNDETWWTFGDGNEEQRVEQVKHTYPLDGTYTVGFKIRSPEGCSDSTSLNIHVKPTPQPSFDILSDKLFCTPNGAIKLDLRNTTPLIDASTYKWYYSGRTEPYSMEPRPSVFSGTGIFGELTLKVVATHKVSGCVNTYTDSIVSSHNVEADLKIGQNALHNVCATNPVEFTSISRYGNLYTWEMGDGTFVYGDSTFTYAYDKPGEYTVNLDVRNKYGCSDKISHDVVVYPLPDPQFVFEKDNRILPEDGIPDDLLSTVPDVDNGGYLFTNQSTVKYYPFAKDQRLNFTWDLTDTVFANYNEKELFHRFRNNGLYDINLYATTFYGCVDSVSDVVRIATVKGLFVPTAFAPSDPRTEVNRFMPKGIGLSSYKMQVYDFRGMCVWSSTKLDNGRPAEYWDGTVNGEAPANKDTYLWKGRAVFVDGTVWEQSGGVVLIR